MKTKEKILEAALQLFNQEGIGNVSMRRIAEEAGIQIGNLTYHFRNRDNLVEALLNQLIDELETEISKTQVPELSLSAIWNALYTSYKIQDRYRFIMLDLLQMFRQYPQLLQKFRANYERRRFELSFALQLMEANGILQKEMRPDFYQEYLLPQLYCLSDFWLSEAELLYEGREEDKAYYYARVTFALLYPHLSEKAKQDYLDVFKSEKSQ